MRTRPCPCCHSPVTADTRTCEVCAPVPSPRYLEREVSPYVVQMNGVIITSAGDITAAWHKRYFVSALPRRAPEAQP